MKRTRAIGFCLLFAIIQALGVVIPQFTNIHENIWPAFGLLLLALGIALVPLLGLTLRSIVLAILVNAVIWYYAARLLNDERP